MIQNKIIRTLIIGSNFGYHSHFYALKKIQCKIIDIASPNIYKKNISNNNLRKFKNYKLALKKNKYDMITCAVPPLIQEKVINYIMKKNISVKYLFFEKPYAINLKLLKKSINYFTKKNILINVNFIFPKNTQWIEFIKLLKKETITSIKYRWFFKQTFYIDFQKSWKIIENQGGGIYYNYLIHLIYNILFIFKEIKILEIKKYINNYNYVDNININVLCDNKIPCQIKISNNSKNNIHHIKTESKKNIIELLNNSKNWTKNFKLLKNKKMIINKKNDNLNERYNLTYKNLKELLKNNNCSENKYLYNLSIIIKSHELTKKISLMHE